MASKLLVMGILMTLMMESRLVDVPNTPAPQPPPPTSTPPPMCTPPNGSPPTTTPPPNAPTPGPGTPPTTPPPPGTGPPPTTTPTSGPTIPPESYPNPRRDDSVQDTYGTTVVKDPYRWMEDAESQETMQFIAAENLISRPFLDNTPNRAELQARYEELYNYPKFIGPFQAGNKFYSLRNTGLQNQNVLYVQDTINCDEAIVLIDPNVLNKNGTTSLQAYPSLFSPDGQILAYLLNEDASDWSTMQFKNVDKDDTFKEKLTKLKFPSVSWTRDSKGLFYSVYPDQKDNPDGTDSDANLNQKLFYHVLGTEQKQDILVVEFPENPTYTVDSQISDCGKYLLVYASDGFDKQLMYFVDLDIIKYEIKTKLELKPIITKLESKFQFIANNEKTFFFVTNKDATNCKIVAIDMDNPDPKSWKDIVPQNEKDTLEWAYPASKDYMVLSYTANVRTVLQLHEIASGKLLKKFELEVGTVNSWNFFGDRRYPNMFFNFESFLTPEITYHCDLSQASFELKIIHETQLKNFDREKYNTEQVHYKSKDGTEIPMYVVHKKDLPKDGKNPTWLYGYGALGVSMLPYFTVNRLVFISNLCGVHAVPNLRGGNEFGEPWHKAAQLEKKQTSFDDFIAAAEFLIAQQYTNSQSIATYGSVSGGLLTAACLNQRPDLFGAVIISGGILDMLRYDKFTIGHMFVPEYGTASDPKQFEFLFKYSPLHNIKITDDKQYPATFLMTADHDDRATSLHSYKFIATLQYEAKSHPNQKNPLIIKVAKGAAPLDGVSTPRLIEDLVDGMCFVINALGLKFGAS